MYKHHARISITLTKNTAMPSLLLNCHIHNQVRQTRAKCCQTPRYIMYQSAMMPAQIAAIKPLRIHLKLCSNRYSQEEQKPKKKKFHKTLEII